MKKSEKNLEKKIGELEEKIKRLEAEKAGKPEKEGEGIVEGLLGGLGFGGILKSLEKSPDFSEKLRETNAQIEKNLTMTGTKTDKPAIITGHFSIRPILGGTIAGTIGAKPPATTTTTTMMTRLLAGAKKGGKEPLLEVVEEGPDRLKVIAEVPAAGTRGIKIDIKERLLTITAPGFMKIVTLPYPASETGTSYKNGILEVKLKKREKI